MGDPKKIRKKYETPEHPWNKKRIELERVLIRDYGLKNKQEIWRMDSLLKGFKAQVKALAVRTDEQGNTERMLLIQKLNKLGLLSKEQSVESVLGLEVKDIMERRLQTMLFKKNLAHSVKQARQFITHGHVTIKGNKITAPGYLVSVTEENSMEFAPSSSLYDKDHPERVVQEKIVKKPELKEEKTTDKKEKIMTEEELEAKKITEEMSDEEKEEIKKIEKETPEKEVKEIIENAEGSKKE